jgi:hypothetical protein
MSEALRQQELLRKADRLYVVTPVIQRSVLEAHPKKPIISAIVAEMGGAFHLVRIVKASYLDGTDLFRKLRLEAKTLVTEIKLKQQFMEEDFNFCKATDSQKATEFLAFKSHVDDATSELLGYVTMNFADVKQRFFRDHLLKTTKRVNEFKKKYPTTPVYGWHKVFAKEKFAAAVDTPLGNMSGPEGDKYVELPESIGNLSMAELWENGREGVKNLLHMELIKVMPISPETTRVCDVFLNRIESWLNYHAAKCYIKRIESVGGKITGIPAWKW